MVLRFGSQHILRMTYHHGKQAIYTILFPPSDRMPLIVEPTRRGIWLDLVADPVHDRNFVKPYDPFKIVTYSVSRMVNDAKHDAPGCIKQVD